MEFSGRQALRPSLRHPSTTDRGPDAKTPLDGRGFPSTPFYTGVPWFLPLVSLWCGLSDRMAR